VARLTKEQWQSVRERWENQPETGFKWLSEEIGGLVGRQGISKKAKEQGWIKATKPKEVAQLNFGSSATKPKVAQQNKSTKPLKKTANLETVKVRKTKKENTSNGELSVYAEKRKVGRPTDYREAYIDQVYDLCLKGYTDKMLAAAFGIDESTLNEWKKKYDKFSLSIARGKAVVDAEVLASVYVGVTTGHTTVEDRVIPGGDGSTEIVQIEKQHKPEVQNQQLWLKNRQSEEWKDKVEVDTSIDLKETSLDFLKENFINVMEKARERDRVLRIDRGLEIEGEYEDVSVD